MVYYREYGSGYGYGSGDKIGDGGVVDERGVGHGIVKAGCQGQNGL